MRMWPNPRLAPVLIDRFSSKDDLVDALVTSSHVPLYLDAAQPLWRRFRGGLYADGGALVDGGRCDAMISLINQSALSPQVKSILFFIPIPGLIDLGAPVPDAIKICVFPPSFLFRSDLHVHPHLVNSNADSATSKARAASKGKGPAEDFPFSIAQLLRWAFVAPADDADIERLYALGQQVRAWVCGIGTVDWTRGWKGAH